MHIYPIVTFKDFIGQHNAIVKLAYAGALISMVLNLPIRVNEGDRLVVRITEYATRNIFFIENFL